MSAPELPLRLQLLVQLGASIWRADWPLLERCALAAQTAVVPRADCEEVLLQAVLFCGFPRVVTAFESFGTAWPITAGTTPHGGALPREEQKAAGRALFAAIYGRNDEAVRAMLAGYHQEFHDFVLEAAYGRILARPGLPPRERELIAVGTLAAMDQLRQFVAHARGALHFGSSVAELREVLALVLGESPQVDAWLQRVRK